MASASMAISRSQFWPNNFLRKGVMLFDLPKISGLLAGSKKDYTQVCGFSQSFARVVKKEAAQAQRESREIFRVNARRCGDYIVPALNQMIDIIASGSGTCH